MRGVAQQYGVISYQGRVQVSGVPFEGTGQFKFALVNAGGTQFLWRSSPDIDSNGEPDQFATLNVTRGLYQVHLGDTALVNMAAIPTSVFSTSVVGVSTNPIYLPVWFNDGVKGFERLVPDQRVGAVSFAMAAATMADGSVTIEKLAPDLLAALQSANNPILQVATLQSQINALSNRLEHAVTLSLEPGDSALLSQGRASLLNSTLRAGKTERARTHRSPELGMPAFGVAAAS